MPPARLDLPDIHTRFGAVLLMMVSSVARAEAPAAKPRAAPTWANAVFIELASGFVPFANDVPLMVGIGVRAAGIHEVWARAGYMPVGDDIGHGFGAVGYRAALRPERLVRPIVGGLVAGLPATCAHDAQGRPRCARPPLFIFAAHGGVRLEPVPWLGFSALLSLGVDTYPNPFGMVELAASFALPLP
jgi:hypothetical protein